MSDRTSIVNNALLMVGGPTLLSWDDTSSDAALFKATYYSTVKARLSGYPWKFALRTAALSRLSVSLLAPQSGYTHVFQLPEYIAGVQLKCLRPIGLDNPKKGVYELFGNELHTDSVITASNDVHLRYVADVSDQTGLFTAEFVHMIELELASKYSASVMEDRTRALDLANEARLERKIARNHDAKSSSMQSMNSNMNQLRSRQPSSRY